MFWPKDKNMFSLPLIHNLDKKLFAQTIKGNVMEVPKPHVHSAILHLNRDCILYAFLPKYVDTKTFKVRIQSINSQSKVKQKLKIGRRNFDNEAVEGFLRFFS